MTYTIDYELNGGTNSANNPDSYTVETETIVFENATKAGYDNSAVTTREIVITGNGKAIVVGDVDGDGKVNVADHVKLSEIIMNK